MSAKRRRSVLARVRGRSLRYLAQYAALWFTARLNARELEFPLLPQDVADSGAMAEFSDHAAIPHRQPRVAWLAIPPSAGSGGHTTQFRMMQAAQRAGQHTTLLLYDRHGGDFARNADVIARAWPWLQVDIRPVETEIRGYDAIVASSWPTAHVLASRAREGRRLYFIQDYEPYFLPRGTDYALAEDSYRFGLRHIALGNMVHDALRDEVGVSSDLVPFGCDTATYHPLPAQARREGVVFYAKRGSDRRGYELALRALTRFHERRPTVPIHVYGDEIDGAPFPFIGHGNLDPASLNQLYNSVVAGLALSFTNISLVAEELLAAGAVPIVNDSPLPRADMPNPFVRWAEATPSGLAAALVDAVDQPDPVQYGQRVSASTAGRSWVPAMEATTAIIEDELLRDSDSG